MVFFARLLRAGCQDRCVPLVSVLGADDGLDSSLLLRGLSLSKFVRGGKNLLNDQSALSTHN
ncbi:MAG: hypothetical protein K0Q67_2680 [Cellvibrio sp.]|jgi:hypothetical protein|nr:hypothetical protein [Cellvibrio sp.]